MKKHSTASQKNETAPFQFPATYWNSDNGQELLRSAEEDFSEAADKLRDFHATLELLIARESNASQRAVLLQLQDTVTAAKDKMAEAEEIGLTIGAITE